MAKIVKEYRHALESYRSGDMDTGIAIVKRHVNEPLILAPESVFGSQRSFRRYSIGTAAPAMKTLREIWRRNADHADKLSQAGNHDAALRILVVNIELSSQLLHIRPPDMVALISGVTLWSKAWQSASQELRASGDNAMAEIASKCGARAETFAAKRIRPVIDAEDAKLRELEQAKKGEDPEFLRMQLEDARKLTKLWDTEMKASECIASLKREAE